MATSDCTTAKRCSKCKEWFPATTEYWHRDNKSADGLAYNCKPCVRNRVAKWQADNHERKVANQRRYRARHADELRERDAIRRAANPEREYLTRRGWAARNPDKVRGASARYAAKHPQHVTSWARRHPHAAKAIKSRYRANKRSAHGSHTAEELKALYEEQCGLCAYCGIRLYSDYQADHVVPLSLNGSDYIENILLACPTCNQSKGGKPYEQWLSERGW